MFKSIIPANIITLPSPCCFLLVTVTFEWDKIHPLVHLSGPSNVTRDSFVKTIFKTSIFMYFSAQCRVFKTFPFVNGGCPGDFSYRSQFTKHSKRIVLLDSHNSRFFNDLSAGQTCFFREYRFSLHKFQGSKFLKPFSLLWLVGWLFGFYSISTVVGYLMSNQFYTNNQFYFKQFSAQFNCQNNSISSYSVQSNSSNSNNLV